MNRRLYSVFVLLFVALIGVSLPASAENFSETMKAAEQGNANAQYNLGLAYVNGNGVTKNYDEAVKWCRKAAEQNIAAAQYLLAEMYLQGNGVAQNYAEAMKWYGKAAEQGSADSQHNLGVAYAEGKGVTQNTAEAVRSRQAFAEVIQAALPGSFAA